MRLITVKQLAQHCLLLLLLSGVISPSMARDLAEIKAEGVLRHVGIPYANFVMQFSEGNQVINSGFDIELMQGFAKSIDVRYEFVPANWYNAFGQLTGQQALFIDSKVQLGNKVDVTGDVMAHGVTIFDWRKQLIDFSDDYFPSAVWLVAKIDSDLMPITPSGNILDDINQVKFMLDSRQVLAMKQSCLDPDLYGLYQTNANIILPTKQLQLNEMVPAMLNDEAESTLLDLADSLIALQKWPNQIKVIGPISEEQRMAVGFRKTSPHLRQEFNRYLEKIRQDGTYMKLVKKYYPSVFNYYQDYFLSVTESTHNEN
ncbi:transporter substrate-binding domain-containing protein [Shewanella sp. NIFS-20-20]|uniref:transporter substrate-binding domain-containing protein n=1 Tax=Shewanella sp. NIFS-20-20 TaxID=2853806 RepID=UPI001C46C75E|nr:transporter substrate-binding domain-containing protein [Shewanella sp. NIFS-20-20]MBV7316299.1 transporter substrate-binding domain-containing protein [Shewanella sp. NIFS-20-20]